MSFFDVVKRHESIDLEGILHSVSTGQVELVLAKNGVLDSNDFLTLLSPAASSHLEAMAQKARRITLQNFGKTIQLYTPLYVSDFCDNYCLYCGYNASVRISRRKLSLYEVEQAARHISGTGLRHILLLTGGSEKMSPVSYIKDCLGILKRYFSSISIEVYPLSEAEYRQLIETGLDALTIYQETYSRDIYGAVHPKGPKRDYAFRLDAPERALRQDIRAINIGALLGLNDFRLDGFFTGLHAGYLQDSFPCAEISVSVPRIRHTAAGYIPSFDISDKDVAQLVFALRIFLPRAGITLSTRESPVFRNNMLALGITRLSAQSDTCVGGWLSDKGTHERLEQFSIYDKRTVKNIRSLLRDKGYQPVFKDWMHI
jgi:2-iminoacetate synthase